MSYAFACQIGIEFHAREKVVGPDLSQRARQADDARDYGRSPWPRFQPRAHSVQSSRRQFAESRRKAGRRRFRSHIGDDVRYRFSADGDRLLETRRMHAGIVEEASSARSDGALLPVGRHRTAIHDEPEDSDVFHVLARRPLAPEVIVTRHYRYLIGVDGAIPGLICREYR